MTLPADVAVAGGPGSAEGGKPQPPSGATPQAPAGPPKVESFRLRLFAICLGLVVLVFWQRAGAVAADTKLDLVVSPWRYLSHAITLWNPLTDGGTLQNQAYGYLFPMGPFFGVGHWLQLPPWVVQRAWESALVVAAFLGTVRLSRLLGMPGLWGRVLAGLAYALAPRMLTELGAISSELLPMAVAPWVLIPLVQGSRSGSPRRAAARSGVALLFAGGINAAATLAILPLPALWLATRQRGKRRAALSRWWIATTALACLWWAIPLLVLGKYSAPFLDFIESSAVTTSQTSLTTTLRGAEHWEAFLGPGIWPAGWLFVSSAVVILATGLVAVAGGIGLSLRTTRHRTFLVLAFTAGLVLVTIGHAGPVHPLAVGWWRSALNGPLDAFRNVHKFDPVVRLPLAIGVGWCAVALHRRYADSQLAAGRRIRIPSRAVATVAALWIGAVAVTPAFAEDVIPQPRLVTDAGWWSQTADWLAAHSAGGRALVTPGAAAPIYLWGGTSDDALEPLARSPWAVRDSVPLSQPGFIRLLDAVETRLSDARSDPTLAALLARSGFRYVVVRNDLDSRLSSSAPPVFAHVTLADSPGFRQVARFGPDLATSSANRLTDLGASKPSGSVTVYEDLLWRSMSQLAPAATAVRANGSADDLPGLLAAGLHPDQPVLFTTGGTQPGSPGGPTVLDEGIRKREAGFGATQVYRGTMYAGQPYRLPRKVHDYVPPGVPLSEYRTLGGVRGVFASSSGSDADAAVNLGPSSAPWSALDSDAKTAWRPGSLAGITGQWLQVDLTRPMTTPQLRVRFAGPAGSLPARVAITTAAGAVVQRVASDRRPQELRVAAGPTSFVRLTVLATSDGSPGYGDGIATLHIAGIRPARTLVIPGDGNPRSIVLTIEAGRRSPCLTVSGLPACDPAWARAGEEVTDLRRDFAVSQSSTRQVRVSVRLRPGIALDRLLDAASPLKAIATSTASADPRERPGAAVDGNPRTGWVAKPGDQHPSLLITTSRPQPLRGLQIVPFNGAPVTRPTRVALKVGGRRMVVAVPPDGVVRWARPIVTRSVDLEVVRATLRESRSTLTGATRLLPVAIGEVRLLGGRVRSGSSPSRLVEGCRSGPTLRVDGRPTHTAINALTAAAMSGAPVDAVPCVGTLPDSFATVDLPAGHHDVDLPATATTLPEQVILGPAPGTDTTGVPAADSKRVEHWSATSRDIAVRTTGAALLVVHENFNAGWQATLHGRRLPSVMVDGWQQAWQIPAHAVGLVRLRFTPQRTVNLGLAAGAAAVALLAALAAVPRRRLRPLPVAYDAGPGRLLGSAVVLAGLTLLGSWVGLAIGAGLLLLAAALRHRVVAGWRTAAVGALLAAAVVIATLSPAPSPQWVNAWPAQLLALAAVGVILLGTSPSTSETQLVEGTGTGSGAEGARGGGAERRQDVE